MHKSHHQPIDALLVGYEGRENLGLRSIAATLEAKGFRTALERYMPQDLSSVIAAAQTHTPDLVGFSIIFQYTIDEFAKLTAALREAGIRTHFTVGGHFPSLRPRETLEMLPHVDSVVCFEGELTAVDLLRQVHQPETWSSIQGLAFRRGDEIVVNPPRPLIADLDTIPPPVRGRPQSLVRGIRAASLLASRGCLYDCSFCSIRQFYGSAPGPLRRVRAPEAVAAEMRTLFERDGVRFFIFQDDDFGAKTRQQRRWVEAFLRALDQAALTGQIRWKVACRVDEVEEELFIRCHDHGLVAVFLGVESGSPASLRTFNKHVTVEQNLAAIETLKRIDMPFDMGFMLFEPYSTIDTIQENIDFLRQVTADGFCSANFSRLLPYAGTPIEARLQQEGRLKGSVSRPDYDFLDPRLDWYALFTNKVFRFRNFDRLGPVGRLQMARFDQILAREFEAAPWADEYEAAIRELAARSNTLALDTLEASLHFVSERDVAGVLAGGAFLNSLATREWQAETEIQYALDQVLATYSPELLQMYTEAFSSRFTSR